MVFDNMADLTLDCRRALKKLLGAIKHFNAACLLKEIFLKLWSAQVARGWQGSLSRTLKSGLSVGEAS